MDLVRWLGEQLDEDERIARAAGRLSGSLSGGVPDVGERWRVSGSHADDGGTYWSVTTASPDLDRIPTVEMVGSGMSGGGAHTEEVAAHIAEHDPARVLREIDAKRQLVERYERAMENRRAHPDDLASAGALLALHGAVKLLALPYADRSGYRDEWRP
jgi:hypothetical protein